MRLLSRHLTCWSLATLLANRVPFLPSQGKANDGCEHSGVPKAFSCKRRCRAYARRMSSTELKLSFLFLRLWRSASLCDATTHPPLSWSPFPRKGRLTMSANIVQNNKFTIRIIILICMERPSLLRQVTDPKTSTHKQNSGK